MVITVMTMSVIVAFANMQASLQARIVLFTEYHMHPIALLALYIKSKQHNIIEREQYFYHDNE